MSEKEKMIRGEAYLASDPELVDARLKARQLVRRFNDADPEAEADRQAILLQLFGSLGSDVLIEPPLRCDYGFNIHIGHHVQINFGAVFLDCAKINIGNYVFVGPNVQIYAATHPLDPEERRRVEFAKPITIGNDVWIGGQVVLCPGVSIGDGSTVGAGSIVTKDVPPRVVVAGNPAKIIRHLS